MHDYQRSYKNIYRAQCSRFQEFDLNKELYRILGRGVSPSV